MEISVENWVWRGVGEDQTPIVTGKTAYRPCGPVNG